MTQHVFARVAGFKLTIIPRAPYRLRYAEASPNAIDVEHFSPGGRRFARLIPDNGGYQSQVDQQTRSLFDVLDVEPGPDLNQWQIETTVYTCDWPRGYALGSTRYPEDPAPFDLIGSHRELIYIQHPRRLPDVAQMVAPNQVVVAIERTPDRESIDLEYEHDGIPWRQRHEVVSIADDRFVVTMQSPLPFAEDATRAAQQVARSLVRYEGVE